MPGHIQSKVCKEGRFETVKKNFSDSYHSTVFYVATEARSDIQVEATMAHDLKPDQVLLLDGGLGTTLEDEHGIQFSSKTPLWSSHLLVENTNVLQTVQRDFANAGADIILTATYQASRTGFANTKLGSDKGISRDEGSRYMVLAVKIARQAFQGRHGLVALSLGAYGASMVPSTEYSGEYGSMTEQDLVEFHGDRLNIFQASEEWNNVDLVAFETLPRLDEVLAVRRVMEPIQQKEYWISCVFPNQDERLPDGTEIISLVKAMLGGTRPPFAIGINCTKIYKVAGLIERFEDAAQSQGLALPCLVVYPDGAGDKVYDTVTQQWIGDGSAQPPWDEQMIDIVRQVRTRARWRGMIVGGCCKISPGQIAQLRRQIDST